MKFGKTGEYPQGQLDESDEGAIQIGITHDQGNVIINFGTPVTWLGFPPVMAIQLAATLLKHANALRREQ